MSDRNELHLSICRSNARTSRHMCFRLPNCTQIVSKKRIEISFSVSDASIRPRNFVEQQRLWERIFQYAVVINQKITKQYFFKVRLKCFLDIKITKKLTRKLQREWNTLKKAFLGSSMFQASYFNKLMFAILFWMTFGNFQVSVVYHCGICNLFWHSRNFENSQLNFLFFSVGLSKINVGLSTKSSLTERPKTCSRHRVQCFFCF